MILKLKPLRLLFVLILFFEFTSAQVWVQLPDFPGTKRDDGVAVTVNNTGYFGTGLQEWNATIEFFALNFSTRSWKTVASMPHTTERQYAVAFPGPDCFYVFGGDGVGGALNNLYRYDITNDTWKLMTPKPGQGLIASFCFSFGDKAIIACGKFQNGTPSREVWEYTISSDSWTQKSNYPFVPVWRASGTSLNGFGYCMFGIDSANIRHKELYKYDPGNDSWAYVTSFPQSEGRAYATMLGTTDRLFVFGGHDTSNTYYGDSWFYNPFTASWIPGPAIPGVSRRGGMACASGQDIYYTTGLSPVGRLTETWTTDVPLAIKKENEFGKLTLFPNPAQTCIYFSLSNNITARDVVAEFYSGNNQLVSKSVGHTKDQLIEFSITQLQKGMYFLRIYSGERFLGISKFVKE